MPKKTDNKKFYTTYEAGDLLFVSHSTIIDWVESGRLKATKTLGGHRRILKSELDTFIQRNKLRKMETQTLRILIVDDDKSIRTGLTELLESKGYKVDTAASGFEAGVLAIQHDPSLIILDLIMQGLDGFSTCRLIKTNPLLRNIKILILTGYPSEENFQKVTKMGADRCLAKPVEKKVLLREIDSLLNPQISRKENKKKTKA